MLTETEVGVGVNDSVGVKEGICEQSFGAGAVTQPEDAQPRVE